MSEQREIERLSTLLNRLQDDVARLQSDIRNIGSSSTSISVAQPAARTVAHSGVTGVTANQHHTKNHASRHAPTQDDPVLLDEDDLASDSELLGATQQSLKAFIAALKLNQIQNPDSDVNWVFANKHLHITFTSPTTLSGVILELLGNTSDKDLLHLHQHTGNPTGETRLQHLEWDHENVIPVRWKNGDTAFYLYFDMIAPTANRLITYPDKDLSFAVDTVAEAIAAARTDLLDEDDMVSDSEDQAATQQSIKAYVDVLNMFGIDNADWIPCIFIGGGIHGQTGYRLTAAISSQGSVDTPWLWQLPVPHAKGGLSLTITDIRIDLNDADAGDYITQIRVFGNDHDTSDTKYNEVDNQTTAGIKESGSGSMDAMTNFDASAYKLIQIALAMFQTQSDQLKVNGVSLKGYYS